MMSGNVFVQAVYTIWTKASRGAPQAAARNRLPDAFALADYHLDQLLAGECYAKVLIHERDGFKPRASVEDFFSPCFRWRWPGVSIQFLNNDKAVVVRYKHESWQGAPNRSHQPVVKYELVSDKLLRVKFNNRHVGPWGEWWYCLYAFSILRTESPSGEMFLAEPVKYISDLAELW
jgi:hypothetical protein